MKPNKTEYRVIQYLKSRGNPFDVPTGLRRHIHSMEKKGLIKYKNGKWSVVA